MHQQSSDLRPAQAFSDAQSDDAGAPLLIDAHGTPVADAVTALGRAVWQHHGARPLLLERDNFVPSLDELAEEVAAVQAAMAEPAHALA